MLTFLKKIFSPILATLDFIQNYFKSLVFILIIILIFGETNQENLKQPNLMQIDIHGPIFSADKIMAEFDKAKKDNIKGVLIDIDTPGGAVSPSIEISEAIKRLKKLKPVIVYASGTMTSGGYYSAIWADKIIANPGSIVGSIGVIMQSANVEELLNKLGVKSQFAKRGTYKEVGTPIREWTEIEKKEIDKVINDTYEMFVEDVANARGLKKEDDKIFADAHIFTSRQALQVGLIDLVDTKNRAIVELQLLSGVKDIVWKEEDKMELFFENIVAQSSTQIANYFTTKLY